MTEMVTAMVTAMVTMKGESQRPWMGRMQLRALEIPGKARLPMELVHT